MDGGVKGTVQQDLNCLKPSGIDLLVTELIYFSISSADRIKIFPQLDLQCKLISKKCGSLEMQYVCIMHIITLKPVKKAKIYVVLILTSYIQDPSMISLLTPFKYGWTVSLRSTWCVYSVGCSKLLFGIRDKMERDEEIKCQ